VIVFASAMMGLGVHHLLSSGDCSTTGYTRYGPAPKCSSTSTDWSIVLPIATFLVIAGGAIGAPNVFVVLGPLFLAIGIGALTVSSTNGSKAFPLVFGGAFALVGAGLLAAPLWSAARRGFGAPASRIAMGAAACLAAAAIAAGVASLFPTEHAIGAPKTAAAVAPNPTGAQFPEISATDPDSLYRPDRFKRALVIAGAYIGPDAKMRSLRLVPGGVDISVVVDADGRRVKDISVDSTGGYLGNDVRTLHAPARAVALSALDASAPVRLERTAGRIDHMTATPNAGGGVDWAAYPVGGGAPTRLTKP
jgi:hypothetical protein